MRGCGLGRLDLSWWRNLKGFNDSTYTLALSMFILNHPVLRLLYKTLQGCI